MPKIKCKCGNIISLSAIPSPHQSHIITDVEFDNFQGMVDAEEIYSSMKIVVHCDVCGRLYIYNNGFGELPLIYRKDES